MKNVTIKARNTIRKTILHFSLAGLIIFCLLPSAVRAQARDKPDTVAIRYIGSLDNEPLFQIEFDNKDQEVCRISIEDESGEILYSEKFTGKKFSRKFKIEGSELILSKLTLTIASGKQSETFLINSCVRTVQDYVITRQ